MTRALAAALLMLLSAASQGATAEPWVAYDGHSLSVEFRDVELDQALQAVTRATGVQFQIGTGVGGRLTKRFSNLPLDRALGRLLSGYSHVVLFSSAPGGAQVSRVVLLPEGAQQAELPSAEMDPGMERDPMDEDEDSEGQDFPGPVDEFQDPGIGAEEIPGADDAAQGDPLRLEMVRPGTESVLLRRHASGHFIERGLINGQPVQFLVDTGATTVAVSAALAGSLGLRRGPQRSVATAGGRSLGFETRVARIDLGPLSLLDVDALVLPAMEQGSYVLLGMSFLAQFDLLQRDNTLLIRRPH